jgi:hypothetical protein
MNTALNHLSWSMYLQSIAIGLLIYYIIIGLKYYRTEIQALYDRFYKKAAREDRLPEALIYQEEDNATDPALLEDEVSYVAEADEDMEQTEEFIRRFKKLVAQAADKSYAPATLIHSLQILFTEYPQIKNSPHRTAISELIANECEQTGTAQLSEDVVDAWWDELPAVPKPGPGSIQASS